MNTPSFVTGAACVVCGRSFPPGYLDSAFVCPDHGPDHTNEGILDIQYDYAAAALYFPGGERSGETSLRREGSAPQGHEAGTFPPDLAAGPGLDPRPGPLSGMWRYRALLPLPGDAPVPPLLTGLTPLYDAPRLAAPLNLARVLVKDDTRQPTASFKDRASALAVALAAQQKAPVIAAASTGNAAAALAGMAASVGQACVLFVPAAAPKAKIAQLLAYGAVVFAVQGSYDNAFDLCMEACARKGWYNRNTAYNPFMAEGKKTAAFEIAEQMRWDVPDAVFVGAGDGCILAGLHKGFADLLRLGCTRRMPRLYGVQSEGSDFLWQAWKEDRVRPEDILAKAPIQARTVADSICASLPRDRIKALAAVRETGGAFLRVADAAILGAIPALAQASGVFAEPAGAASLAGLQAAAQEGLVAPSETVCLIATGSGLKDTAALTSPALSSRAATIAAPIEVAPNFPALEAILDSLPGL